MSDADKHMDNQFRKMSEELQATYHKDYWNEAANLMDNGSLDDAFREAAANYSAAEIGGMDLASGSLSDAFMDEAFREAAADVAIPYQSAYWNELQENLTDIEMSEAFHQASNSVKAQYNPSFWGDADAALQEEGLHYEYKSAYWNEAKDLLDKADRRSFFYRWGGVATLLLLISALGWNELAGNYYTQNFRELNGVSADRGWMNERDLTTTENAVNEMVMPSDFVEQGQPQAEDVQEQSSVAEINDGTHEVPTSTNATGVTQPSTADINDGLNEALVNEAPENSSHNPPAPANEFINQTDVDHQHVEVSNTSQFNHSFMNDARDEDSEEMLMKPVPFEFNPVNIPSMGIEVAKVPQSWPSQKTPAPLAFKNRPKMVRHDLAITGRVGIGNSYGIESFISTPRYSAGLEYTRSNSGRFRRIELGFNVLMNYSTHENVRKEIKVDSFLVDGSSKNYWVSLRVFDLFYTNANALVNFKLNRKNKIRFGFGLERLTLVQSNMSYKTGDVSGLQTVNNNWGVRRGITNWDYRFTLGYEYRLNKRLSMNVLGTLGMADRTSNDFYSEPPIFDREMNVMFGVKYDILTRIR